MGSYNKALRDKKDLEKKLNMYTKEHRSHINGINLEKELVQGGLLDLQSKTKNLNDTMECIAKVLKEDGKKLNEELGRVQTLKKIPPPRRRMFSKKEHDAKVKAIAKQENNLLEKIEQNEAKLEWITGQSKKPEIDAVAGGLIGIFGAKRGFKAMLGRIRAKNGEKLPEIKTEPPKPDFSRPQDICELIDEFHKLPKLYEAKPKKKKPEKIKVFMEEYNERQKERELAMNYGTRTRIKRAKYYCDSLTNLYTTPFDEIEQNRTKTGLATARAHNNLCLVRSRAMSH